MSIENITTDIRRLRSHGSDERLVTTNLAYAIASNLPLPPTPVELLYMHYNTLVLSTVKELLGKINEVSVIRVKECMDIIERLYAYRYYLLHPVAHGINWIVLTEKKLAPVYLEDLKEILSDDQQVIDKDYSLFSHIRVYLQRG